jgi:thioredoxin-like negative regulator of GroEL
MPNPSRASLAIVSLMAAGLLGSLPTIQRELGAQELPPRTQMPPGLTDPCEDGPVSERLRLPIGGSNPEEAQSRLSEAGEAAIQGEDDRARSLLQEASLLDPTSPEVAYRLGRILETTGEVNRATLEYCTYLALEPQGPDAPEVRNRLQALVPRDSAVPSLALEAYREGLQALQAGSFGDAAQHFSRALAESPGWADAHYNRALAYLGEERTVAAASDLERYLEFNPEASDRTLVEARLRALAPRAPVTGPSPSVAFATGLLLPGMGHVYTGRPGRGILILAATVFAAGAGALYEEVDVRCRVPPVGGTCPSDQVAGEVRRRPYLVPGLAAAGAIGVAGAIHAWTTARSDRAVSRTSSGGVELRLPVRSDGSVLLGLGMEPGPVPSQGEASWAMRLRLLF